MTDTSEVESYLRDINSNLIAIGTRLTIKNQDSTVYEELVRIRKAVENEVVVSSE